MTFDTIWYECIRIRKLIDTNSFVSHLHTNFLIRIFSYEFSRTNFLVRIFSYEFSHTNFLIRIFSYEFSHTNFLIRIFSNEFSRTNFLIRIWGKWWSKALHIRNLKIIQLKSKYNININQGVVCWWNNAILQLPDMWYFRYKWIENTSGKSKKHPI